jgi:hypothetical protein
MNKTPDKNGWAGFLAGFAGQPKFQNSSASALVMRALFWSTSHKTSECFENQDGARCRFRTCDPYRVKVMLYH